MENTAPDSSCNVAAFDIAFHVPVFHLSSERAPLINKPVTVKKIIKGRRRKIGRGSQMGARLTVGRNITLTLTLEKVQL
jgi:hypothetical protein